jgi:4-hydroxy-2-oxoglutarate aldolase
VSDALRFFDDHDELYWNVTGDDWDVPIQAASARIILPEGTTNIRANVFTGAYSSRAQNADVEIAGTGVESVRETVDLTNQAAEIGYKVAMVRTPHYYKNLINNAAAQMLYFRAVAVQVKIPIFIYNWPQVTGVDIPAEAVAELSHHPNIIAIKESSGNLEKVMRMIREVKSGFQVLTGSAPTLAPSLAVGCSGAVLAFANAAPYATVSIWEAHRTREPEAALDWQNRISHAAFLVTTKYGVPGLKYAMDLAGYYGGPPRVPLTVPCPAAKREIEEAFADLRG